MTSIHPFRAFPFEPTAAAYEALAQLLTAVWPEQPSSVAWLERADSDREPQLPFRREVALEGNATATAGSPPR